MSRDDRLRNRFGACVSCCARAFHKACRQFWKHAPVANDEWKYPGPCRHAAQYRERRCSAIEPAFGNCGGARREQSSTWFRVVICCLIRALKFTGNIVCSGGPRRNGWMECVPVRNENAPMCSQCAQFTGGGIVIAFNAQHAGACSCEARAEFGEQFFAAVTECA